MEWQRQVRYAALLLSIVTASISAVQDQAQPERARLVPISRAKFCVTKGAIEEAEGSRLEVTVPEMRAVVAYSTKPVAEAKLIYLGPTSKDKPLRSGQIRRQFGLKLRAQNGCNLVYAMWRIEPKSELVVSVKLNPGKTTNAECGTNGYSNIKPTRDLGAPRLKEGENHMLRAEMEDTHMRVFIDGKLTWEGDLGRDVLSFDGPSGVRTDNGHFKFQFFSSEPISHRDNPPCHAAEQDE